jgi:hypothetical protein
MLLAIALLTSGCGKSESSSAPASRPRATSNQPTPAPDSAPATAPDLKGAAAAGGTPLAPIQIHPPELFANTFLLQDDILRELERAKATEYRPVGVTSLVFRAELDVPFRAAFKAATWQRPGSAVNEVAAYRLARCLGIDNVPPAVLRRVPASEIERRLAYVFQARWSDFQSVLAISPQGYVEVAVIYWIEDLQDLGLESWRDAQRVLAWLAIEGEAPPDRENLAKQLSTLIAFDYLIGNWDRWSGGNVKGAASGDYLYMRDHDAGFAGRISESLQRRMLEPVKRTQRYSRGFVVALRALDREKLIREFSRDPLLAEHIRLDEGPGPPPAKPVLDTKVFDELFDRRDTLLTYITSLIDEYGEARVLSFP